MNKELIRAESRRISHVLQNGSSREVLALYSPGRSAALIVQFLSEGSMSINVREVDGDFSLCIDGLNHCPAWVAELGQRFVTEPSKPSEPPEA